MHKGTGECHVPPMAVTGPQAYFLRNRRLSTLAPPWDQGLAPNWPTAVALDPAFFPPCYGARLDFGVGLALDFISGFGLDPGPR